MPATLSVDAIDFTRLLLSQFHEDDRALRNHRVDHQSRKHCDEDGTQREAEVTLAPANVAIRVLDKELEGLPAAQPPINILLYLIWHLHSVSLLSDIVQVFTCPFREII